MKFALFALFFIASSTAASNTAATNTRANNNNLRSSNSKVPFQSDAPLQYYITPEFSVLTEEFKETGMDGEHCPLDKNGYQSVLSGLKCIGHKCLGLQMKCSNEQNVMPGSFYSTLGFSEEEGSHNCPPNYVITGLQCSGRLCDNIHLQCTEMTNKEIDYRRCSYSGLISREISDVSGDFVGLTSADHYPVGIACDGAYCEYKNIQYCYTQ